MNESLEDQKEFEKQAFLKILPADIRKNLEAMDNFDKLIEVVLDLGRKPEARFPGKSVYLEERFVKKEDIDFVVSYLGTFDRDNRAGIERTLHRISAVLNRRGDIIGLTCRVGRAIYGTIEPVRDIIESNKNILLLGKPGVGKTTLLREVARVLSDDLGKRVIVVDTSNEIAGDGDIPHPGIGSARRMQVPFNKEQEDVMIEAVENHFPEVIIIDEIGRTEEAKACRTIAERGVRLIGTAHGTSIENILVNPMLQELIGGITAVTLGDEEAAIRGTQKTILERKSPPTFDVLIELRERGIFAIYHNLAETVDALLRGFAVTPEIRKINNTLKKANTTQNREVTTVVQREVNTAIFPLGIKTSFLERGIHTTRAPAYIVRDLSKADVLLTTKGKLEKRKDIIDVANRMQISIEVIDRNTLKAIKEFLRKIRKKSLKESIINYGELEKIIRDVIAKKEPVELSPASKIIRDEEQAFIARFGLRSEVIGLEPERRIIIYPEKKKKTK